MKSVGIMDKYTKEYRQQRYPWRKSEGIFSGNKKGSQEIASLQEGTSLLKSVGIMENSVSLHTKLTLSNSLSAFFYLIPFSLLKLMEFHGKIITGKYP